LREKYQATGVNITNNRGMAKCEFGFVREGEVRVSGSVYKISLLEVEHEEDVVDSAKDCFVQGERYLLQSFNIGIPGMSIDVGKEHESRGKCGRCKADVHVKFKRMN
jgi:hypothetical protein